ncbi:hypothetical protein PDESU_04663 [Pontiella desulfatans]|uniref:Uncharacterized protein n=1 Tax=Pontiella desulfatans TaxID=2750659 RepID=A0A6C2U8C6_PONDE|nr:hypothetical protein [Pontiella desulfatans]VGO16073.1 hypothetical protein PDESU_04663 [Pontiella desulfatans]
MRRGIRSIGKIVIMMAFLWSVPAMGAGRISQVRLVDGKIELTVETTPGGRYQLQCRDCLCSGAWSNEGPEFVAVAGAEVRTVAIVAASCNFRVVKVGQSSSEELPSGPGGSPPPPPPPRPVRE